MKNLLFLFLVLYSQLSNAQQVDINHCLAYTDNHRIPFGNAMRLHSPDEERKVLLEPYYISNNIYSISIKEQKGIIYLSWLVCDDRSGGYFLLTKDYGNNDSIVVKYIENLECPEHAPLLYSFTESNVIKESCFYTLYKISKEGNQNKIVTLFIPILDDYKLPPVTASIPEQ